MNSEKHAHFGHLLITWYRQNFRQLPWRQTRDPYAIWLSEIILQQTRIQQGLSYYLRFLDAYPTVEKLANAPVDDVLKLWQGLGYYSRARNLHETARVIQRNCHGVFPPDYQSIRKLKGIGDYTAAAIASISFGKPFPVLDGNVYRVMTRYNALNEPVNSTSGKKRVMEFLTKHISTEEPGDFNQALMELGALVCLPRNPDCHKCPLSIECKAYNSKMVEHYPVPAQKKPPKTRYLNYLVFQTKVRDEYYTYLYRREENDIWKGLYEFPLIETDEKPGQEELINQLYLKKLFPTKTALRFSLVMEMTHILTHQKLEIMFFVIKTRPLDPGILPPHWICVPMEEVNTYPLSRMTEKFLER